MKMKKLLALLLASLLLLALVACGEPIETETTTAGNEPETPEDEDPTPNPDDNKDPDLNEDTTPTPVILGTEENPAYILENSLTVTLEAGQVYYVGLKNPSGQRVYIENANAVISCNGTDYTAVDGMVEMVLGATENADSRQGLVFTVKAANGAAAEFVLHIEAPLGSMGNPYALEAFDAMHVTLAKDEVLYYKWTATNNGTFRVLSSETKSNIVLTCESRTTGDSNGSESIEITALKGTEILIALGTNGAVIEEGFDVSFAFEEADPNTLFTYTVKIFDSTFEGLSGVTVELRSLSDNTLITTLTTDENGSATYSSVWCDCYAKIIVPDGYTLVSDNDEDSTNDDIATFKLGSGEFGTVIATFSLYQN